MDYAIKLKRKNRVLFKTPWIWKLAFKDARQNFSRLFLFISSIIIGIAGLVAIDSFNFNLQNDINNQAKELLGADLALHSNGKPFNENFIAGMDTLNAEYADDARFASMVFFPQNGGTRLIQVIALEGAYPFYGELESVENSDITAFRNGQKVLIDESLAIQYSLQLNDTLKLGKGEFVIGGFVTGFPGNTNIGASFAPVVYLPYSLLDSTGLIQFGSRVNYSRYYKLQSEDLGKIVENLKPQVKKFGHSYETVESRKENLGEGFGNLYRFFNLLGFVALILGSIGVASSVHIYVKEKTNSAAILRCLGASGWQIFYVFFIQTAILGLIGSVIGVLHGVAVQFILPWIVSDFLPIDVNIQVSWMAVLNGLLTGLTISILFSILPLSNIRFVPPLVLLRASIEGTKRISKFRYFIIAMIILLPWLFAIKQTGSFVNGSIFFASLLGVFGCLFLVARGMIYLVRKFFPRNSNFIWRQSLSNLFRPNNQTIVLVVVIGLGAFLIATMALIQNSLLGQVEFVGSGERSNTVLFDIQPYQKDGIIEMAEEYNLPVQQVVPIVTTRVKSVRGRSVAEIQEDTSREERNWALTREYRITYRDSLISSEEIIEGEFMYDQVVEGDSIFISVSDGMKDGLKLNLKDEIVFDVQGVPVTTYVGSIRKVDWQRIQTNFMVVFPMGVLEEAPQFFVLITRIQEKETSAAFQQDMVKRFPNVSAIDLTLILETLDEIFDKVAFVIRFMALFSVITGLFVLSGAVINSKYARLKENVLLRTLGAVQKQLVGMTLIEYGYLGLFAGLAGSILAVAAGWALSIFFFEILFFPDFVSLIIIWVVIAGLTVFVGWINTRSILNKSPLEVLRKEV